MTYKPHVVCPTSPLPIADRERLASALVRKGAHVADVKAGPIGKELSWYTIAKAICGHPVQAKTLRKLSLFVETLEGKAA